MRIAALDCHQPDEADEKRCPNEYLHYPELFAQTILLHELTHEDSTPQTERELQHPQKNIEGLTFWVIYVTLHPQFELYIITAYTG